MSVNEGNLTTKLALLFVSIVLFSLLITSTVFVSGCIGGKQLCTADNLTNCSNNAACYKGECTPVCEDDDSCAKGYECKEVNENTEEKTSKASFCVQKQTEAKTDTATSPPASPAPNGNSKTSTSSTSLTSLTPTGGSGTSNSGFLVTTHTSSSSEGGASSFMNFLNSGIPLEILSSSLVKFFVMFLLLFAIVFSALETAKFPADTQNSQRQTRFIIAVAFSLIGAVGILIYPGLFPVQLLATKFVMLLVIIVIYYILSGFIFSESTWLPNASLLTSFSRKFVAFVFFITLFTMLFLDTPVNMSIENYPVCYNTSWNEKICNDANPVNCIAADYGTGSLVCCAEAYSSSVGKIGKYNYCKKSVESQKEYFLSAYYPGKPTPDDALCSFDTKYEMPKVGHNMCATLGEFFIGPGLYRDYKYIVLQFLWMIAGGLALVAFYNRFHDRSWFWWAVVWLVGLFILLMLGWF